MTIIEQYKQDLEAIRNDPNQLASIVADAAYTLMRDPAAPDFDWVGAAQDVVERAQ